MTTRIRGLHHVAASWTAALLLLLFSSITGADPAPEVARGIAWLASQVQPDGSLAGENSSIATPLQGRAETLYTLQQLATAPAALADAIAADTEDNTEYLARRAIALRLAGRDVTDLITALTARQNVDGGCGGAPGHESNPLDTAWVLLALKAANSPPGAAVPAALGYLQSVQSSDGAYQAPGRADVYTSALGLQALSSYANAFVLSGTIQPLVNYLLTQQTSPEVWEDSTFLTALSYTAIHEFVALEPTASAVRAFLSGRQSPEGSWEGGDPYVTALALRALALTVSLPANPTLAVLQGRVIDAQTGGPLGGVTASLSGPSTGTLVTAADGRFALRDLVPGSYSLTLALPNYGTLSTSTALRAGETRDLGTFPLSKTQGATTGTVRGTVIDGATGLPLPAVTIAVSGGLSAVSGSDGQFLIPNVPPGTVTAQAQKSGYLTVSGAGTLVAGGVLVFSPALTAGTEATGAAVQGTVADAATGAPLAGVTVGLSGAASANTVTDAAGSYRIAGLTAGAATLSASLTGYDSVSAGATLLAGSTVVFSPRLYPAHSTPPGGNTAGVTGIVLDAGTNTPLPGVTVTATFAGRQQSLTTGADGRFVWSGITEATMALKFTLAGYVGADTTAALEPLITLDIGQVRLRKDKVVELLPDLVVQSVSRAGATTDPQTLALSGSLTAVIGNTGTASAPANIHVLAFLDANRNGVYDAGIDAALGEAITSSDIAPGAAASVSLPVQGTLPFRDAPIAVWVDSTEQMVELKETNNIGTTASACSIKPDIRTFKPVLKWAWTQAPVITTPIVGPLQDTNGDGKIDQDDIPAIVFTSFWSFPDGAPGVLHAVSGQDGHDLWAVSDPALYVGAEATPALADIDGDGKPEVVAYLASGGIAAFNHDGTLKWKSAYPPSPGFYNYGAPTIADLDGDGKAEIIARNYVLNSDGTLRFQFNSSFNSYYGHSVVSLVADLDMDGVPEIVMGSTAVHADGSPYWRNPSVPNGRMAIANFDDDRYPEIVVVENQSASLVNHDGSLRWGPVYITGSYNAGAPTIADMDGDGIPDIGVAGATYYTVLNWDGSVKWQSRVYDGSGMTGSTVFDFDGDGQAEVVYFDEQYLRVYRGATGEVLFSIPNSSVTASEYPVVADVDNDNHADLVVPANYGNPSGIRVFQDQNNSWVNTRRIWNQYAYHITNINDDGSVPRVEQNSWQVHNTYRLNAQPGVSPTAVPDLTASYLRVQDKGGTQPSTFTVRVGNGGSLTVWPGVSVAFYNGTPQAGGVLLGTAKTSKVLGVGQFEDISLSYPNVLAGINDLVVAVDDNGTGKGAIQECDETNNQVRINVSALPGTVALQVGTDQAIYGANADVMITADAANLGSFQEQASVRFSIESADGTAVVATPPGGPPVTVAANGAQSVPAVWNTGTTLAGQYHVKAELLDSTGQPLASALAPFTIVGSSGNAASAIVTADKPLYAPFDSVRLSDRIINLTQNQVLEALSVVTAVYRPDGSVLWTQTAGLAQFLPATLRDVEYTLPLAAAASGAYRVTLSVRDSADTELAFAETAFTVESTATSGSGLKGSLTASPQEVPQGDAVTLSGTIENLGNADVTGLPVKVAILDPQAEQVAAQWSASVDLARAQPYQDTRGWTAGGAVGTTYVAVLSVTVNGQEQVLAQASFQVIEAPVEIDVHLSVPHAGRVLALASCLPSAGGQEDPICLAGRVALIDDYLTALGVEHFITTTEQDFRAAFRSGVYNLYWLSGGAEKLKGTLAEEVREAVFRGDGLLLDGVHDERNKTLDEVAGVLYRGKLSTRDQPIAVTGAVLAPVYLDTIGQPLKLELAGASLQASFNTGKDAGSPAIVSHIYGEGHALMLAFDLVGTLHAEPLSSAWRELIQAALGFLTPEPPAPLTSGAYVPVEITVQNLAQPVALELALDLPPTAVVVAAAPEPSVQSPQQLLWRWMLPAGAAQPFALALRAPEAAGAYALLATLNSIRNGETRLYGSYPLTLAVADAGETGLALLSELQALAPASMRERQDRDRAAQQIEQALIGLGQGEYESAIGALISALDNLTRIASADIAPARLGIDRLLAEAGWRWLKGLNP